MTTSHKWSGLLQEDSCHFLHRVTRRASPLRICHFATKVVCKGRGYGSSSSLRKREVMNGAALTAYVQNLHRLLQRYYNASANQHSTISSPQSQIVESAWRLCGGVVVRVSTRRGKIINIRSQNVTNKPGVRWVPCSFSG